MVNGERSLISDSGSPFDLLDILVNLLVVVKAQQLNIELLWDAYSSGQPPPPGLFEVRDCNSRLMASMEQVIPIIAARNLTSN